MEHIVYFVKQSEINQTDILHEIVDRLRFITERMMLVEEAIGVGYITGAGSAYGAYSTPEISPQDEVTVVTDYSADAPINEA